MVRFDYYYFFFFLLLSILQERHMIRDKKKIFERNLRLLKVKFGNKTIPSVVYPRLMQPQILYFRRFYSIKRKVTPRGFVLQVNPTLLVPITI